MSDYEYFVDEETWSMVVPDSLSPSLDSDDGLPDVLASKGLGANSKGLGADSKGLGADSMGLGADSMLLDSSMADEITVDSMDSFVCETEMEEIPPMVSDWFDTEEKREWYMKLLGIWCPLVLQVNNAGVNGLQVEGDVLILQEPLEADDASLLSVDEKLFSNEWAQGVLRNGEWFYSSYTVAVAF